MKQMRHPPAGTYGSERQVMVPSAGTTPLGPVVPQNLTNPTCK